MSSKTLCQHFAEYVVSLQPQALPREVLEKAKAIVQHNLAISFGGIGTDQVDKALALVKSRDGTATLVGQPFKASAADAAFYNSVAVRALRMEDMVAPSMAHPGACLVPAALALAEQYGASGIEMLSAVVIGYEVIGKAAGSAYTWDTSARRTPSHIYNALGVAAAAAKLMRLDVEQTTAALAHACNLGALITEGILDFQYGILTRNGMFAAQLGEVRAPAPLDALEGPHGLYEVQLGGIQATSVETVLSTLSKPFEILSAVLKPHPCGGTNLVPIAILRREMRERGLKAEDITRVTVLRPGGYAHEIPDSYGPFEGYLGGMYLATASLPFALAALMIDGEITQAHFLNPNDPRIGAVIRRVAIEFTYELASLDHKLIIQTRDGRTIEASGSHELLTVPNAAAILEKYALPLVGKTKVQELQQRITQLDGALDVHSLAQCLAVSASGSVCN